MNQEARQFLCIRLGAGLKCLWLVVIEEAGELAYAKAVNE